MARWCVALASAGLSSAGLSSAGLSSAALLAGCGGSPPPKAPEESEPPAPDSAPAGQSAGEVPASLPFAPPPPILLRDVGLKAPAAALHDTHADAYLVSNINGGPADRDGNGFISRLSPEGSVLELKWIDGRAGGVVLDAPKGMALGGDKLYVADIDHVRIFDVGTGKGIGKVGIVSASFLSGVAVDPAGNVYASDTGWAKAGDQLKRSKSDAIYVIDAAGAVSVLYKGEDLGQPTGLSADADGVWVANLEGQLLRLDKAGKKLASVRLPAAHLDGVVRAKSGRLLVASADGEAVFAGMPKGPFEALISELKAPAGIGYDERRAKLLVPLLQDDAVYVQALPGE